eukprot:s1878_g28.t1
MDTAYQPGGSDDAPADPDSSAVPLELIVDPCAIQHSVLSNIFALPVKCPPRVGVPVCLDQGKPTLWILHLFSGRRRVGDCHWWLEHIGTKILPDFDIKLISVDTAIDRVHGDLSNGPNLTKLLNMAKRGLFSEPSALLVEFSLKQVVVHVCCGRSSSPGFCQNAVLVNYVRERSTRHHIEQWAYGAIGVKPTCLRALNLGDPEVTAKVFKDGAELWRTRPAHGLKGRKANGQFKTAQAKEYPSALCRSLIVALLTGLRHRISLEGLRAPVEPTASELNWISLMINRSQDLALRSYLPDYQG